MAARAGALLNADRRNHHPRTVVHLRGDSLPPSLRDIVGDALWTAMVVWLLAAAVPTLRLPFRSGVAIAISYGVEFSQLYSSPALDALCSVTLGHLLLGSGFDRRDFVAYAVACLLRCLWSEES